MDEWWVDEDRWTLHPRWQVFGEANFALQQLSYPGDVVDIRGKLLDDAPYETKFLHDIGQARQGMGLPYITNVYSVPGAGRDIVIYLRDVVQHLDKLHGTPGSLEMNYFGCLVGDGWAVLTDVRPEELEYLDNTPDYQESVFDVLGPGVCLWWNDKARSGLEKHALGGEMYDILLVTRGDREEGGDTYRTLVYAEPPASVKRIFDWLCDPTGIRAHPSWSNADLMITENRSGISVRSVHFTAQS